MRKRLRFDQLSYLPAFVLGCVGTVMLGLGRWVWKIDQMLYVEPDDGD